jgi:hypothetical protein
LPIASQNDPDPPEKPFVPVSAPALKGEFRKPQPVIQEIHPVGLALPTTSESDPLLFNFASVQLPRKKKPANFNWDETVPKGGDAPPIGTRGSEMVKGQGKTKSPSKVPVTLNGNIRMITNEEREKQCTACGGELWHYRKYCVLECGHIYHTECFARLFAEEAMTCKACQEPLFVAKF